MIPASKYDDKAFMLSELCEMFKVDELTQLADMASFCPPHMSKEEFDHKYMKHLKFFYLEHLNAIQTGTYKKVPFQSLNQRILEAVNSNAGNKEYPLMPDYKTSSRFADNQKNRDRIQSMLHHLHNKQK